MNATDFQLSELPYTSQWKITGYVQIAWFIIILVAALFTYFTNFAVVKTHFKGFAMSFSIFVLFKILGGITATVLFHNNTFNTGVYIATYIFDSIAVGGLLRALFPFLQVMLNEGFQGPAPSYFEKPGDGSKINTPVSKEDLKPRNHLFRLLTIVVLAAIIISIVGSSQINFSNPSNTSNTLLRVSSVLFIASIVLCALLLGYIFMSRPRYAKYALLILLAIPLVFVRCLYSVLSAFHGLSYSSPYLLVFGDYKYYAFMALLCEGVVSPIYLITLHVFINHYNSLGY